MSIYYAGTAILNKNVFENIKNNVKENIYEKIERLGTFDKYNVVYGVDVDYGFFIQFEKLISYDEDFDFEKVLLITATSDDLSGNEFGYIIKQILPYDSLRYAHCAKAHIDVEF